MFCVVNGEGGPELYMYARNCFDFYTKTSTFSIRKQKESHRNFTRRRLSGKCLQTMSLASQSQVQIGDKIVFDAAGINPDYSVRAIIRFDLSKAFD